MRNQNKGKAKYILASCCFTVLIILTYCSIAANTNQNNFHNKLTKATKSNIDDLQFLVKSQNKFESINVQQFVSRDTPPVKVVTIDSLRKDSTQRVVVDTFDFKISKDTLDGPVVYHADDSMVLDVPGKKLLLYGKISTVNYGTNELAAPEVVYDQRTNLVKAFLKKDSLGKVISYVSYNAGDFKSVMDSITFNMKTGRGITKGTYTQQGEMYVYGEKIKREGTEVFYALNSRFTTCNLDTPHFAFVSKKIKFINQKMAFSGPVHPEFEGVPLPIVLPFGIYPLKQGRHSGILPPTFTANNQLGIALEGVGYYKVFSDNLDLITRGNIYSYGGWTANINPRYFKRYHYQGSFSFDIQKIKPLDEPATRTINVRLQHSSDSKARPGVTFNANVNAGSSRFNSRVPNSPVTNFTNQLQSTVAYSKVWKNKPYNISLNGSHNQNTTTKLININLPDVAFNVNTLYPFRRKEPVGPLKWYENLGLALNSNARSLTSFYDTAANITTQISNNFQYGASHSVPITLSLPPIGVLQVGPQVSYSERWYQTKFIRQWNASTQKLDTTLKRGFYTARDMSFGVGLSTRIFGLFSFRKSAKVQAIRHEIRPSLSVNYKPDFTKGTYYSTQVDTAGTIARYSLYDGSIYGAYGEGKFGGLNFSIDNNISMKVRNRKDTSAEAVKKVNLIDGLRIDGGYNFLQDSFKLTPLSISARSTLFEKINITAGATIDPYRTNAQGRRIDELIWKQNPISLGTVTNANVSLQSSFRGGDKKNTGNNPNDRISEFQRNAAQSGIPLDEYQQEAMYVNNNPGEFADFTIPWSIDFSYSFRIDRLRQFGSQKLTSQVSQDVNWNGSVNLTEKWKVGVNGFYNITAAELGTLSMFLSRDLHCWQMSINVSPVGLYKFFNISISPKSPILRDIKVNRTRSFSSF